MPVRYVAFYLPQFYPFPENDLWWGKGFTEWTNVTKAAPLFEGHYQPHLPTDLGFYDLRLRETQHEQIAMAKSYGVDAFCFHYYWFSGKRLLDRPVDDFLTDPAADMPFCLCWANENWTRRWDAAEQEVLIAQRYEEGWQEAFIDSVVPFLKDPRYLRANGRPLLIVYRPQHIPDIQRSATRWRERCRELGIGEIHLVSAMTHGNWDYGQFGFDAGVEFPPHNMSVSSKNSAVPTFNDFNGYFVEYGDVARDYLSHDFVDRRIYRTVFPSWDNTARVKERALAALGASPANYERWLEGATKLTRLEREPDDQLVFINAWNEWAEGCHLEPDRVYGHQFLDATRRAKLEESTLDALYDPSPFANATVPAFTPEHVQADFALKRRIRSALEKHPKALETAIGLYRFYQRLTKGIPSGTPTLPRTLRVVPLKNSAKSTSSKSAFLSDRKDSRLVGFPAQTVRRRRGTKLVASQGTSNSPALHALLQERSYESAPLAFGRYNNAVVDARALSLITESGLAISETTHVYELIDPQYLAANHIKRSADGTLSQPATPVTVLDEQVLFPIHASFAFGHCVLDALPQMLYWKEEIKRGDIKVGLSKMVPSWFQDMAALWGFESKHFVMLNEGPLLVRSAMISNALGTMTTFLPNPLALKQFGADGHRPSVTRLAPLYLRRGSAGNYSSREIENEEAVVSALAALGFTILDPAAIPYTEQVAAFANASLVVGAHGSAFANLMWCQPGTPVIDLMPDHWVGYWGEPGLSEQWLLRLTGACDLDYSVLLCPSTLTASEGSRGDIRYAVNVEDLLALVRPVISQSNQ